LGSAAPGLAEPAVVRRVRIGAHEHIIDETISCIDLPAGYALIDILVITTVYLVEPYVFPPPPLKMLLTITIWPLT
jgi:hypothetical protein